MTDWVYLEQSETGGGSWFPDEPGVVASYRARGWRNADPPGPESESEFELELEEEDAESSAVADDDTPKE